MERTKEVQMQIREQEVVKNSDLLPNEYYFIYNQPNNNQNENT